MKFEQSDKLRRGSSASPLLHEELNVCLGLVCVVAVGWYHEVRLSLADSPDEVFSVRK